MGHDEKIADLYAQYTNIWNNLWSVYAATAVVLLGLSISAVSIPKSDEGWIRWAVALGFLIFTTGNLKLIHGTDKVLRSLKDKLSQNESLRVITENLNQFKYVMVFRFTTDACVYAAVLLPMLTTAR